MPEQHCAVSKPHGAAKQLKERLKEIEAVLCGRDPEEGYEWPEPEPRDKVTAERG